MTVRTSFRMYIIRILSDMSVIPAEDFHFSYSQQVGRSSVGIATELRAGRSGIESRWGRDFPPVQTGPGAHPASCKKGTVSFLGVKCGRGVLLTTHSLLVPRSWKSYTSTHPLDHTGPVTGSLYLFILSNQRSDSPTK